jgi:hypothetical protein
MTQGRVQNACIIETNVRSLTASLRRVIPSSVKIPSTALGIVRRFVVNYDVKLDYSRMVMRGYSESDWTEAKLPKSQSQVR